MSRIATAPPRDASAALERRLRGRLDCLTKPRGSLGQLEDLATQVGVLLGSERPRLVDPQVLVFAADHGIADEGVSAYPKAVTAQMLRNYLGGGAAINVLVRQHGLALTLVDAGVQGFSPPAASQRASEGGAATVAGVARGTAPRLVSRRIADGTRNCRREPAMSAPQCDAALAAGREVAAACMDAGSNVVLLGEMGIGNTASAALLLQRLTGWPLDACVGRGTGVDDDGLRHKLAVLAGAAARRDGPLGPLEALAEFGGFEIAMLVGAMLEASSRSCLVVVDGFTVSVAALLAERLAPGTTACCVFSHRSAEQAHGRLLEHLGVRALLDLGLRLGEGSGAALAWPLLQSSLALLDEMACFEAAGVSDRDD
jgi:nicotinate-nucleotide--dimethylbenzimidazole phosphoribosyltransferase